MRKFDLTDEQASAVSLAADFVRSGRPEFRIGGYAGTGKTTVIKTIVANHKRVSVCALTGKAVSVLRRKGVRDATTIHKLIYHFEPKTREFFKKQTLEKTSLIVVDEASMIDGTLYDDLMSFGVPVIFVGDMGQLEPVGRDINLMDKLDVRLETIHRQALDNPIIEMAGHVRTGGDLFAGQWGSVTIANQVHFWQNLSGFDQIICAKNRTRIAVNKQMRFHLGRKDKVEVGEKIICLRNNRELGVFNGMLLTVKAILTREPDTIHADVITEDGDNIAELPIWMSQFGVLPLPEAQYIQDAAVCDYGYAVTCHKSQGSEWGNVLVLEEPSTYWDMKRWRYTAITRASERLTYCI